MGTPLLSFPTFRRPCKKQRADFLSAKQRLRDKHIIYSMLYPARLRVVHHGKTHFFTDPHDALRWVDTLGHSSPRRTGKHNPPWIYGLLYYSDRLLPLLFTDLCFIWSFMQPMRDAPGCSCSYQSYYSLRILTLAPDGLWLIPHYGFVYSTILSLDNLALPWTRDFVVS